MKHPAPTAKMISDMMPVDTPAYMFDAWIGALHWAIATPKILNYFEAETGNHWKPGRTPIDRMIDEATGADRQFIEAFIAWFNVNLWGPVGGKADGNE